MDILALFEQFAWMIESASTIEELRYQMAEITSVMGFQYFAMVHHVDYPRIPRKVLYLNNYPESLVRQFEDQRLMMSDPVHRTSQGRIHGFPWSAMKHLIRFTSSDTTRMMQARALGIEDGYTIPANVSGEASGSCSFAVGRGREIPTRWLPFIQEIGSRAFDRGRKILRVRDFDVLSARLTDRQIQCVLLMAQGNTAPDIAAKIGRSTETVNSHLKQARETYGVDNKTSLVIRTLADSTIVLNDLIL